MPDLEGIRWPSPVPQQSAALLAFTLELERTQWWTHERLLDSQLAQLRLLLRHASAQCEYYRRGGLDPEAARSLGDWQTLPILDATTLRSDAHAFAAGAVPSSHGSLLRVSTSGSTGEPLSIHKTEFAAFVWHALTLRDHFWHRREFDGKLIAIRSGRSADNPNDVRRQKTWGTPVSIGWRTGEAVRLYQTMSVERQVEVIAGTDPDYLLAYPGNVLQLARHCAREGIGLPSLRQVRTYGEVLTADVRDACQAVWGVGLADSYSSEETGYLALQCPAGQSLHLQSEAALVEVLTEDGQPCQPGEIGRIVVTPLHNFATPLIRYAIGDYAEVAPACGCGRGLPSIARVLGRSRNRACRPDGSRFWPRTDHDVAEGLSAVDECQIVQSAPGDLLIRYRGSGTLSATEIHRMNERIHEALPGLDARVRVERVEESLRGANGKLERFVCLVPEGGAA